MSEFVVYPGTFDPITNGHLDILSRAQRLFKHIIVLVVKHREKAPLFSMEERIRFAREATKGLKGIEVDAWDGLLANYLKKKGAKIIIRGLRAVSDFDYEFQMCQLNRRLYPELETIFIMAGEEYFPLSSSTIKEIAFSGGDISQFVPQIVVEPLKRTLKMGYKIDTE
ncbi:pantetheine-phosphate adenylyltransferase [candidate division WOR-3 bacterium]|nr:pantetheine-phosphate adenylyltransferase [candidate division WOR-3 bacterium]